MLAYFSDAVMVKIEVYDNVSYTPAPPTCAHYDTQVRFLLLDANPSLIAKKKVIILLCSKEVNPRGFPVKIIIMIMSWQSVQETRR